MSVTVTLTVEVGAGPARSTHVVDVQMPGDNERFAADSAVVGTMRALAKVLDRMPPAQHECQDISYAGQRQWPNGRERRAAA